MLCEVPTQSNTNRPMADEPFKATDEDWQRIEEVALSRWDRGRLDLRWDRTIHELRDRVAALEAAPDRVLVRNQTGEYLRAGTPVYMATPPELDADAVLSLAAIIRSVDGDHNLGAAALAEAILSHPDVTRVLQLPAVDPREVLAARPLLEQVARMADRIGQHTVAEIMAISDQAAAWLAEQGGTPEPTHPQYFSSHHAIAGEIWGMLPDAPEPSQALAGDGGLREVVKRTMRAQDLRGWDEVSRAVILAIARWLRGSGHFCAATDLEREAQR